MSNYKGVRILKQGVDIVLGCLIIGKFEALPLSAFASLTEIPKTDIRNQLYYPGVCDKTEPQDRKLMVENSYSLLQEKERGYMGKRRVRERE